MKRPAPIPRALAPDLRWVMRPGEEGPLHRRLYRQFRAHILEGRLAPGERLPSTRTLAAELKVARNTVEAAFAQLVTEGFLERRVGAGTVVSASVAERLPAPSPTAMSRDAKAVRARPSARGRQLLSLGVTELRYDETSGPSATNLSLFPAREWTRMLVRSARRGGHAWMVGGDSQGLPDLRREIATHVGLSRGLRCGPEHVLVLTSTQEALDLAARVMLDPGDTVVVEDPGYLSAHAAFAAAGARLHPVPVSRDGLVTRSLPRGQGVRLAYVTPSHQFPIGVPLALSRRLELLHWAAERDAWIIEDDYDSEFCYDGRPIAALQSLDPDGRVLYLGTWNKVLFPGLRLAYMVLPESWIPAFVAARRITSGPPAALLQAVLTEFMATGRLAAHLRHSRLRYQESRDALLEAIAEHWGDRVELGPARTGLHVLAHLADSVDDVAVARAARRAGLAAGALSRYHRARRPWRGLVLNYGAGNPASLRHAAALAAPALRRLARYSPSPR